MTTKRRKITPSKTSVAVTKPTLVGSRVFIARVLVFAFSTRLTRQARPVTLATQLAGQPE